MQTRKKALKKGGKRKPDQITLSGPERIAIRICLAMFGCDWNRFATWLRGHPERHRGRIEDLPLVERLAERDKHESILQMWLENAIIENLRELDVHQLNEVHQYTRLLIDASEKIKGRKSGSGARRAR